MFLLTKSFTQPDDFVELIQHIAFKTVPHASHHAHQL